MLPRRYLAMHWTLGAVALLLLLTLGVIQTASDALYSRAAAPTTLPMHISPRFGETVYRVLDRIAPAPYVEATLARDALERGDADAAQRYAVRLPAGAIRDEFLARIAAQRGDDALAFEYFFAAPDAAAVQRTIESRATRDPATAYAQERLLAARLALLQTHPDAVAQARWRSGLLANETAWRQVPGSARQRAWLQRALIEFEAAVSLSPLSEQYAIAAANQADLLGDRARAAQLFGVAAEINPASADALAGLGVIAFQRGDAAAAAAYLSRARRIDPNSAMVRALERDLR